MTYENGDDLKENKSSTKIKIEKYREEIPLIRATAGFNSFLTISPFAETTAIQTGDLLYRSFPYLQASRIGETYMLNSKSSRYRLSDIFGINLYMTPVASICEAKNEERHLQEDKMVKLPKPLPMKMTLEKAIMRRRSYRQFEGIPIQFDRIASILYYGNGISGKMPLMSSAVESEFLKPLDVKLRTTPSAGGLYPLDIYLIAMNVRDLSMGVYLYMPTENALISVSTKGGSISQEQIYSSFEPARDAININNAGFIIIITGKLWKQIRKYGNRGLKYMLIEAGEIAENIHLSAQSFGIGTVDVAGYYDREVEELIGIDGTSEYVMHTIIGGII